MLSELSIFLPTYNEEGNIKKSVESALSNAKKIARKYEVIVVLARGSTDNTEKIVKDMMKKNKKIRLVYQEADQVGYGVALKLGIVSSRYGYIFYTDSDNQYDMKEISKLLPYLKDYDIVYGRRMKRKDVIGRIVLARIYNLILGMLFRTGVRDIDSAFKLYKKRIFEKVKLKYNTGIVDAEIIIKAQRSGFKVKETDVHHYYRKSGKAMYELFNIGMIRPNVISDLIKDIIRLWLELYL